MGNDVKTQEKEQEKGSEKEQQKPASVKWDSSKRNEISDSEVDGILKNMLDAEKTGGKESPAEKPVEDKKPEGEKKEPEKKPEPSELDILKAEKEKLQNQVSEKEAVLQAQATEMGDLRVRVRSKDIEESDEAKAQSEPEVDPLELMDDPKKMKKWLDDAVDTRVKSALASQANTELEQDKQMDEYRQKCKDAIHKLHPNFDELIDEIADASLEAGDNQETVDQFKKDPYQWDFRILQAAAKVAEMRNRVRDLEEKVEKGEKKADDHSEKISKASKIPNAVTASSGGGSETAKDKPMTRQSMAEMSTDELKERLKQDAVVFR